MSIIREEEYAGDGNPFPLKTYTCLFYLISIVHAAYQAFTLFETYRKISNISRTNFQNLNVSHLVLQLSLPNPLKPGVKLRLEM